MRIWKSNWTKKIICVEQFTPPILIKNGLKKHWHWLAYLFSLFGVLTVFGTGNATQVNTITTAIDSALYNYNLLPEGFAPTFNLILGIILAALIALILIGGIKRIGQVTEKLVPFMAVIYILLAIGVVVINFKSIPTVFGAISGKRTKVISPLLVFITAFKPSLISS